MLYKKGMCQKFDGFIGVHVEQLTETPAVMGKVIVEQFDEGLRTKTLLQLSNVGKAREMFLDIQRLISYQQ